MCFNSIRKIIYIQSWMLFLSCFIQQIHSQNTINFLNEKNTIKTYKSRIESIRKTPGLAAFWDFVLREDGINGSGNFMAYTAKGDKHQYVLEPHNISREFWYDGEEATLDDFPLVGCGPFGQAIKFTPSKTLNNYPVLMVPRAKLNDSPLDVKGPGKSVSMLVWMVYQKGIHAIAGLWTEGTDAPTQKSIPAEVKIKGQRQYALFSGLAANPGAVSVHLSENGISSFGDIYARHLATTKEKIKKAPMNSINNDSCWSVLGFVFDNNKKVVTAYLDGKATEYWIENPATHPFYKFAANAWRQAKLSEIDGLQAGEQPSFPKEQFYTPPEDKILSEKIISESKDERIVIRNYEFTKVRFTLQKDKNGKFNIESSSELVELKANPYWFGHDIYSPQPAENGSPFTIGGVIYSFRGADISATIGGVAVFSKALSPKEMNKLSKIGRTEEYPVFRMFENK